ncbi:MAG: NADH-quinone oxidoreductase subunit NuoE [Caloramator sp.]|nr:NADH-quinone oxidoreductase subunit NuoE [Caloramator sp.]
MAKYDVDEVKLRQLEEYIDSLEQKEGALIGVLYKAQEIFGYLPKDVQLFIARKLGITAAKVYGVATFYSYFTMEPRGKHVINVCMGTACFVKGADKILEEIKKELDIKEGNMSKDGLFTVDTLRCVGACGLAPVVMVDGKVYGRVKIEDVKGILDEYRE